VSAAAERVGRLPRLSGLAWASIVALVALLAIVPLVYSNDYILTVMVTAGIVLVLNTSWNFVLGIAGVWNFGQLAIYALGGYGTGLVMLHTGLPGWLCVVLGGVIAAGISILLAFPTLRLYGIYTSLLTFAFASVVQFIIVNDGSGLTGGSFGLDTVEGLYPDLGPSAQITAYYWTVLAVIVIATFAVAWIRSARLGIALQTVRDAPAFAAARGVNPLKYRIIAFAISGFIAGIAGALYVSFNQSITPSVMGLTPMSIDVTMLVIGGLGTIAGPALGTTLLTIVQSSLVDYPGIQLTILGTILLVIVVFVPGGLVGLISRIKGRVSRWIHEGEDGGAEEEGPSEPRTHAVTFDMPEEQPPEGTYPNA
jgi:branched-chain amino acid transport system permease protein